MQLKYLKLKRGIQKLLATVVLQGVLCVPGVLADDQASGNEITVTMWTLNEQGPVDRIGTIRFTDTRYGVLIEPNLRGLAPGLHAAHVHENPSCVAVTMPGHVMIAGAAGDHYDPQGTKTHAGPYANGHPRRSSKSHGRGGRFRDRAGACATHQDIGPARQSNHDPRRCRSL